MENKTENNLIISFSETLINDSTKDLSMDLLEFSLDTIIESALLKQIPIAKSLVAITETGITLKNHHLIRQTLNFMNELNNGTVSIEKKEKFSKRLDSDDKKAQEEIERVMLILESTIDSEKSILLAKFVATYINEEISYRQFHELTDILNRFYLSNTEILLQINSGEIENSSGHELHRIERLGGMGLIQKTPKTISFTNGQGRQDVSLHMTSIGTLFCNIII